MSGQQDRSIPRPVFVIGTGRTGTNWLSRSLADHPDVRATIEGEPQFGLSTRMALNASLKAELFDLLVTEYRNQLAGSKSRIYLDKSHPNIWLAERLKEVFPNALFLGTSRNPFATVASMLRHKEVSDWHRRWREFPIPNRFLGISIELAKDYDKLPATSQCATRWLAHHKRMNELEKLLGNDLFVVSYESFANDPGTTLSRLQHFLGLQVPIPVREVRVDSLEQWRNRLSDEEVAQIEEVVREVLDEVESDVYDI